ncbi:MAG: hypothetical protein AB1333_01500 [Patescibacteria group bacterium]
MKKGFLILLGIILFILLFCSQTPGQQCNGASWSFQMSHFDKMNHDGMDYKKGYTLYSHARQRFGNVGVLLMFNSISDSSWAVGAGLSYYSKTTTTDIAAGPKYSIKNGEEGRVVFWVKVREYIALTKNIEIRTFLDFAEVISADGYILYYFDENQVWALGITGQTKFGVGVIGQLSLTNNFDISARLMTAGERDKKDRIIPTGEIIFRATF